MPEQDCETCKHQKKAPGVCVKRRCLFIHEGEEEYGHKDITLEHDLEGWESKEITLTPGKEKQNAS